jgi:hypothetical protein
LPLLVPVRLLPLIGNPLADLLQPDLRVLANLGYGSITNGWSPGPANVPTPFGLFPTDINPADVVTALAHGAVQGVTDALDDLRTPTLFDTSSLSLFFKGAHTAGYSSTDNPSLLQLAAGFATLGNAGVPVSSSGGVVNTLASVVSNDLAVVKPLTDTALAIGASLPNYDAQLFTSQLKGGNLLSAIGLPIAADFALVPYALLVGGIFPVVGAAATTVTRLAELTGTEPNPTGTGAATVSTNAQPALVANVSAAAVNPTTGTDPGSAPATPLRHRPGGIDLSSAIARVADAVHQFGNTNTAPVVSNNTGAIKHGHGGIDLSSAIARVADAVHQFGNKRQLKGEGNHAATNPQPREAITGSGGMTSLRHRHTPS